MRRNINNSNLTKGYILSKISQIKIFSVYLNIPETIIQHCINTGELICSTIRIDNHPTCGFKYDNRGKLKFKDFTGFIWGDCFDIAAYVISAAYSKPINIENKRDFIFVLQHIAYTFRNIIYGKDVDPNIEGKLAAGRLLIQKSKPIIEFVVREWNNRDIEYWNKIGVDLSWLNINFIYAVDQYYINRKVNPQPKYFYDQNDPCYAYVLGRDSNGTHNVKLYFPKRKKHDTRFITNCNHLEGIYNLERDDYDYIIITKSTKDRIALSKLLWDMHFLYGENFTYNIGVINIPAENYRLSTAEYYWLYDKLKDNDAENLITLMDNDRTGYSEAIFYRKKYRMPAIIIPKHYNVKDFAELREKYTAKECANYIIQTIKTIQDYVKRNKYIRAKKESDSCPF